jgi:hypothetical protein
MLRHGLSALLVFAIALAMTVSVASAKRQPTFTEREALTTAMPAWLRAYPIGCVWLDISVSNNGGYAKVGPEFVFATHPPCVKYASNGYWVLKKSGATWKIIFNGSSGPACSLRVPRDLVGCIP